MPLLGKLLGIVDSERNIMASYILPESCIPIVAGTVQRMKYFKKRTDANKEKINVSTIKFSINSRKIA